MKRRLAIAVLIALALTAIYFLGYSAGYADASTSRSAQVQRTPSGVSPSQDRLVAPGRTGAPQRSAGQDRDADASGAPSPAARPSEVRDLDVTEPSASAVSVRGTSGIASWMPERYGPDYLALPGGPGITVEICAARCLVMVSNDAGPSLAMQRAPYNRVADIGVLAWERVCDLPRAIGLCRVTVERLP